MLFLVLKTENNFVAAAAAAAAATDHSDNDADLLLLMRNEDLLKFSFVFKDLLYLYLCAGENNVRK